MFDKLLESPGPIYIRTKVLSVPTLFGRELLVNLGWVPDVPLLTLTSSRSEFGEPERLNLWNFVGCSYFSALRGAFEQHKGYTRILLSIYISPHDVYVEQTQISTQDIFDRIISNQDKSIKHPNSN